jgi:hypothetical protein
MSWGAQPAGGKYSAGLLHTNTCEGRWCCCCCCCWPATTLCAYWVACSWATVSRLAWGSVAGGSYRVVGRREHHVASRRPAAFACAAAAAAAAAEYSWYHAILQQQRMTGSEQLIPFAAEMALSSDGADGATWLGALLLEMPLP